jgi:hypothetical protein
LLTSSKPVYIAIVKFDAESMAAGAITI